jgi:DNA-binding LytR/AlgR family response regulator
MDDQENKVYGEICFKVKKEPSIKNPDDINYIKSDNYSTDVFFDNRPTETKTASLAFMLPQLDPAKFVRINGSTIVKLSNVKLLDNWQKSDVVEMKSGQTFDLSPLYAGWFRIMYKAYRDSLGL